jgi:hypothetical protein
MKTILEQLVASIDQSIEANYIEKKSGDTIKWYINTYYIYKEEEFIKSIIDEHIRQNNEMDAKRRGETSVASGD